MFCQEQESTAGTGEMDTGATRGPVEPDTTTKNKKTREQKRQREYYVKTKSKRRRSESDCESDEQNVQSDANLFTAAQIEEVKNIVFEYMTTDFEKDKPSSSNLVSGLTSGLLCGIGAMGIGSKILQNKEIIGTLASDFLGRLGQGVTQLPLQLPLQSAIQSTGGEETHCAPLSLSQPSMQPPPLPSSDSVDVEKLTLVRNC